VASVTLVRRVASVLERASVRTDTALPWANAVEMAAAAGFELDPWQADVLTSSAPRLLLCCGRQVGKSQTVAMLVAWTAIHVPGALCLAVSPSLRQSQELFRKVTDVYSRLDWRVPTEAESALRLELRNGSRVISLPGSEATIRGYSAAKLIAVDEAARIPDDLIAATRPMLATSHHGRLLALSSPWGKRGWFWRTWTEGEGWERVRVLARACPRISGEFLEAERRALSPLEFASEYECEFLDLAGAVFRSEDIAASFDPTVTPLFGGRTWLNS